MRKAFAKDVFINQERKLGSRRLDTVVVLNHKLCRLGIGLFKPISTLMKIKVFGFWGSMVARLKLKGIDGRAPPGVEPAANLTQHGETYQVQT